MRKDQTEKTLTAGAASKLNKEVIRRYEDPEYKKAAEEYEKKHRRSSRRSERADDRPAERMTDDYEGESTYSRREAKKRRQQAKKEAEKRRLQEMREKRAEEDALFREKDKEKDPNKRRKFRIIRNIIIIVAIIIALLIGYFMFLTSHLDRVDTSDADFAISPKAADTLSGYRNIAVLGVDAGAG